MDAVFGIIGFILGIILFLLALDNFKMIFIGLKSVIGLFILCWVFGIIIAWFAWKIAIVVGIIALIAYIVSKMFRSNNQHTATDKNSEDSKIDTQQQESNGGNSND